MKCGVGDYCCNLAKALSTIPNIRVGVLTSIGNVTEGKEEEVEIFPIIRKWHFGEVLTVIKIIQRWSPNIVHIQYPTQGYDGGLLPYILPIICLLMRKQVVQTWHEGCSWRQTPRLFLKAITPGWLVVVRPQFAENIHSMLRWSLWNKKLKYIPNASSIPKNTLTEHEKTRVRNQYLKKNKRLIIFFGFVYPAKGVELLFRIANPDLDQIIIAGEISEQSCCGKEIIKYSMIDPWVGNVTITGFLSPPDAAALLAVADAVILPFRAGGGEWNTSIHGAVLQGAFVITTSRTKNGYDEKYNIYYATIDDVHEMKTALDTYAGMRRRFCSDVDRDEWQKIASEHHLLYDSILVK